MKNEDFEKVLSRRLDRIKETLGIKAKEYVRNNDRLHNFNVGADITNTGRHRVLDGFLMKHYISYRDMLDDIDNGKLPTPAYIDEKIGDIINYFILQEASMLQDLKDFEECLIKRTDKAEIKQ